MLPIRVPFRGLTSILSTENDNVSLIAHQVDLMIIVAWGRPILDVDCGPSMRSTSRFVALEG